jgi:hypothetical protein
MTTTPTRRPFSIQIAEPAYQAFAYAAALIRLGYVFSPDFPVHITETGQALFTLILGEPGQAAVEKANGFIDLGNELEAAQYERDVQARAEVLLADYKRAEHEKQVAALKRQQAREIAALEKANAAALAAL